MSKRRPTKTDYEEMAASYAAHPVTMNEVRSIEVGAHGMHPVGPSTDYLVCNECDYCAQTDPDFTSWEDHWRTHE